MNRLFRSTLSAGLIVVHTAVAVAAGMPAEAPPQPTPPTSQAPAPATAAPAASEWQPGQDQTIPTSSAIVKRLRALQHLQDRIAQGDVTALRAHREMLNQTRGVLMTAPMACWNDPRNVEAAIAYVLGGGAPDILTHIKDVPAIEGTDRQLLLGTLAYTMGDEASAASYLMTNIDARNLPPTLAGQIAMVQATLVLRRNPRLALGYLDLARALSAGTLVEEAALRRSLVVAGGIGDIDRFEQLSSAYIRRFRNSVYAGNFREKFMHAVARMNFTADDVRFSQLVGLLDQFDAASRLDLYLFIARRALIRGNVPAVKLASSKALELSGRLPQAHARATFYMTASDITSDNVDTAEAAFALLLDLDPALFSNEDEALLETVLDTARQIRTLEVRARRGPTADRSFKDEWLDPPERPAHPDEMASLNEARALLVTSDDLLRRLAK